jgi:alpha-1,3/alpha-1,6-mannosyltransferase
LKVPNDIEVLFLLSVPGQMKTMLLEAATLLLYTPSNEHFGIVPLEAMLAEVPVLAVNSGGPLETIVDGETGWLRSADNVGQWTSILQDSMHSTSSEDLQQMGEQGKQRVKSEFSERKLAHRLDDELESMLNSSRKDVTELPDVLLALGLVGIVATVLYAMLYRMSQSSS